MARPFSIPPADLFARLMGGEDFVIIDIRVPDDVAVDNAWLPGSHRASFDDPEAHLALCAPDCPVVIACHGGLKLSQGAAARLALRGVDAGYLQGGVLGWRAAGLPLVTQAPGIWVCDGTDVVSHWLASRILPKPCEILQVEPDQVSLVAERFGGTVLPNATGLMELLDRPNAVAKSALDFGSSDIFTRLARGGGGFAALDAWMRGAVAVA